MKHYHESQEKRRSGARKLKVEMLRVEEARWSNCTNGASLMFPADKIRYLATGGKHRMLPGQAQVRSKPRMNIRSVENALEIWLEYMRNMVC